MMKFSNPEHGQSPITFSILKALHDITVLHEKEQLNQHIGVDDNVQEFSIFAVAKGS